MLGFTILPNLIFFNPSNNPISIMKYHFTSTKHFFVRLIPILFLVITHHLSSAQSRVVTGKVADGDGKPLASVNVKVEGSTVGTITDFQGGYKISVPDVQGTLLSFSSVGYRNVNRKIGAESVINVAMFEDISELSQVVVTATTQPVRKLETVTAVEVIDSKQIARSSSVNIADAIKYVPGVFVHTGAGRTRSAIWMRGFPDNGSNGLIYTSLLFDGLRTFASPEMVPDAAFRMDMNVEKIEIVRGSAATLYGRGAAAGAINVISKTGGLEHKGAIRLTGGNNNLRQLDFNINGPINESKTLRYNVGGMYLTDNGFRNNLFPDEGGQIRANFDYVGEGGNTLRLSTGLINMNIQNQIDVPYAASDLSKPYGSYTTRDIALPATNDLRGRTFPITYPDGTKDVIDVDKSLKEGNLSRGFNVGLKFNINLGGGFVLNNNGRYQDMLVGTQFDFPLTQYWGSGFQNRALFAGGSPDQGSRGYDFINETRLSKKIELGGSTHNLTAGYYYSNVKVRAVAVGVLYSINKSDDPATRVVGGFSGAPGLFLTSLFRNGTYNESVGSFFVGDEMKFNDKLTINVGFRSDAIGLDMTEDRYAYQRNAVRKVDHSGTSFSLGFNYLLGQNTALYGNFVSAYRAPDYSSYTTIEYAYRKLTDPADTRTLLNTTVAAFPKDASGQPDFTQVTTKDELGRTMYTKPYVDKNEQINSMELGYRTSFGDFSFDGGIFLNNLYNRLVSTFVGATAVSVPAGDNRIYGGEVSLTFTPQAIKGLYLRTSLTQQHTEYTALKQGVTVTSLNGAIVPTDKRIVDLAGNRVASVPSTVWNLSLGYESNYFGFNVNNNFVAGRPVDAYNTLDYPTASLMDANVFVKLLKNSLKLKMNSFNLLNMTGASSVVSAQTDDTFYQANLNGNTGNFKYVRGVPFLPQRFMFSAEISF
jgi:outer membrane receptor protein involved in Fe transport